jgi:hypothetical protein
MSWEDVADGDTQPAGGEYLLTPEEEAAAAAEGLLETAMPQAPASAPQPRARGESDDDDDDD